MLNVSAVRENMPVTREWVYLNTGEGGLLPGRSARSMTSFIRSRTTSGTEGRIPDYQKRVRRHAAQMLNAVDLFRIIATRHQADSIHFLLKCIRWKNNGTILCQNSELIATHCPRGVACVQLPTPVTAESLLEEIDENTQLVFVSSIDLNTGSMLPLRQLSKITHDVGALFMVDASYTAGAATLDMQDEIDILISEGNRWLLCPDEICFVYSTFKHAYFKPNNQIRSIEHGQDLSPQALPLAGSYHSLRWLAEQEIESIQAHINLLKTQLIAGIAESDFDLVSPRDHQDITPMVYFKHQNIEVQKIRDSLRGQKIVSGAFNGCNVLSLHLFNTPLEIDRTLDALSEILLT